MIKIKKTIDKHKDNTCSVCFFKYPISKMVSCSDDSTCMIWEVGSFSYLTTIFLNECVNNIIKYDNNRFVVCSTEEIEREEEFDLDSLISCYSISSEKPYYNLEFRIRIEGIEDCYSLLKLDENLILGLFDDQIQFQIFSTHGKNAELMKKFKVDDDILDTCVLSVPILSKYQKNTFYLGCEVNACVVNYESEKIVRTYLGGYGICVYQNNNSQEMFCSACEEDQTIYFYNPEISHDHFKSIDISFTGCESYCTLINLGNDYLCAGGSDGTISLLSLRNFEFVIKKSEGIHKKNKNIYSLNAFKLTPNSVSIASCSRDQRIQIFDIVGLRIEGVNDDIEKLDLMERISFFKEKLDDLFFSEVQDFIFTIKLEELEICGILKILFFL